MSTNKDDDLMDLDSILSEINTSIKKEVTKAKLPKSPVSKNTKKKQQRKSHISEVFAETTKIIEDAADKTSEDQIQNILNEIHSDRVITKSKPEKSKNSVNSEKPNKNDKSNKDLPKKEENRFISVTAVVEENSDNSLNKTDDMLIKQVESQNINQMETIFQEQEDLKIKSDVNLSDTKINLDELKTQNASPLSVQSVQETTAPKVKPDHEISRENNPHIKKIRDKKLKPKPTTRQKRTAFIGAIMTLFIIIGVISSVVTVINMTQDVISQKGLKSDLALAIFPFVIIDVPEFESPEKLDNNAIISSAIWEFIIDKEDKSQYPQEQLGSIFVPEIDIEHYIRKLYGPDLKIKHQTVSDPNVIMVYNPDEHVYNIDSAPRLLPYKPRVDTVEQKDNIFTVTVSYLVPDVMWSMETNKKNPEIDKVMTYTLIKNDDGYQIKSVKFVEFGNTTSSREQTTPDINESNIQSPENQGDKTSEPDDIIDKNNPEGL